MSDVKFRFYNLQKIPTFFVMACFFLSLNYAHAADEVFIRSSQYGPHKQLVDIYEGQAVKPLKPAILMIHGGGWGAGSRSEFKDWAMWFAQSGAVAFLIDYRLSNVAKWPSQAEDVEEAVWGIRENANALHINPDKIFVVGGSAGGHLAAWLGTTNHKNKSGTSSRANFVISMWGPWDLTAPPNRQDAKNMIAGLMGNKNPKLASPLFYVDQYTSPTLILHGTADSLVPLDQSIRACEVIKASHGFCKLVLLEGENHAISKTENAKLARDSIMSFIKSNL